jgi:hypothetical protein
MFGRIKQVFTPGEVQAQQLQQKAFEQDPEAGIRDVTPEVKPVEASPEASVSDVAETIAKPTIVESGESAISDIGTAGESIAKDAGSAVADAGAEAGADIVASLVPGVGTAVEAGLLLYQGIEGLKDLFSRPSVAPPPEIINEAQPTFQAGI